MKLNKIEFALNTLAFFAFALALAGAAHALPRTYVSMSGNDANTCAYASPCRTFKEALTKTDAGGEVIALETGSYGILNINKAVSIIAPQGVHAEIAAPANFNAIVIQAAAQDVVVLRNIYLSGMGVNKGVEFKSGAELHVENCVITGFNVGLNFNSPSLLYVKDTTVRKVAEGIRVNAASGEVKAFIEHCRFEGYKIGVSAVDRARVTIRDSTLIGLSREYDVTLGGIIAIPNPGSGTTTVVVENCQVSNNHFGLLALGTGSSAIIDVSQTMISENGVGAYALCCANQINSFGNNRFARNGTNGAFTGLTELQ